MANMNEKPKKVGEGEKKVSSVEDWGEKKWHELDVRIKKGESHKFSPAESNFYMDKSSEWESKIVKPKPAQKTNENKTGDTSKDENKTKPINKDVHRKTVAKIQKKAKPKKLSLRDIGFLKKEEEKTKTKTKAKNNKDKLKKTKEKAKKNITKDELQSLLSEFEKTRIEIRKYSGELRKLKTRKERKAYSDKNSKLIKKYKDLGIKLDEVEALPQSHKQLEKKPTRIGSLDDLNLERFYDSIEGYGKNEEGQEFFPELTKDYFIGLSMDEIIDVKKRLERFNDTEGVNLADEAIKKESYIQKQTKARSHFSKIAQKFKEDTFEYKKAYEEKRIAEEDFKKYKETLKSKEQNEQKEENPAQALIDDIDNAADTFKGALDDVKDRTHPEKQDLAKIEDSAYFDDKIAGIQKKIEIVEKQVKFLEEEHQYLGDILNVLDDLEKENKEIKNKEEDKKLVPGEGDKHKTTEDQDKQSPAENEDQENSKINSWIEDGMKSIKEKVKELSYGEAVVYIQDQITHMISVVDGYKEKGNITDSIIKEDIEFHTLYAEKLQEFLGKLESNNEIKKTEEKDKKNKLIERPQDGIEQITAKLDEFMKETKDISYGLNGLKMKGLKSGDVEFDDLQKKWHTVRENHFAFGDELKKSNPEIYKKYEFVLGRNFSEENPGANVGLTTIDSFPDNINEGKLGVIDAEDVDFEEISESDEKIEKNKTTENKELMEVLRSGNNIPYEIQEKIVELPLDDYDKNGISYNAYYKGLLAEKKNLSEDIINKLSLSADKKGDILPRLAKRDDLSSVAEINIFNNATDKYSKYFLARNESLSKQGQLYIAENGSEEDKNNLAVNKNLSEEVALRLIYNKPSIQTKVELAANTGTSSHVQNILADSEEQDVLMAFGSNKNIYPIVQEKLFNKNVFQVDRNLVFLKNNLSEDVRKLLRERYKENPAMILIIDEDGNNVSENNKDTQDKSEPDEEAVDSNKTATTEENNHLYIKEKKKSFFKKNKQEKDKTTEKNNKKEKEAKKNNLEKKTIILEIDDIKNIVNENISKQLEEPKVKEYEPEIKFLNIKGLENKLSLNAEITVNKTPVGGVTLKISGEFINDGNGIKLSNQEIDAGNYFKTVFAKKKFKSVQEKIIPEIKKALEEKQGKEITSMNIKNGTLILETK